MSRIPFLNLLLFFHLACFPSLLYQDLYCTAGALTMGDSILVLSTDSSDPPQVIGIQDFSTVISSGFEFNCTSNCVDSDFDGIPDAQDNTPNIQDSNTCMDDAAILAGALIGSGQTSCRAFRSIATSGTVDVPNTATLALVAPIVELGAGFSVAAGGTMIVQTSSLAQGMFGFTPSRNMVSDAQALPSSWDVGTGLNIKWAESMGSQSYGGPVLSGGRIFIGTNNEGLRNPLLTGDRGNMMAFDADTGQFLWQSAHAKLNRGNDWPLQGVRSPVSVEGERLWYVSNRSEVIAADIHGFRDGVNDGPYTSEANTSEIDEDILWKYDLIDQLDVFPHSMVVGVARAPLVVGELVFVITGNGVDESDITVPSPDAPSFIAINKQTGQLVWEHSLGEGILHGQWSSPAYGIMGGTPQVLFAGGDGWIYSFEPLTGSLLWKFDMNPKDSVWRLGGAGTRNNILSIPVIHGDRVYVGVGQDTEHGEAPGHFWAIDGTSSGDVTSTAGVWHRGGTEFNRTVSTAAIADGIVYMADLSGFLYAVDAATGSLHWTYDAFAGVHGSPLVADGKVYLGDEDGDMVVIKAGPGLNGQAEVLAEIDMGTAIYTTPIAQDGVIYIATRNKLFAIGE